ncbi:MAG: ABC transporter permease [Deltaproteobacteria bacterium]|jgi:peptide/nickel transport system permease protein|nr:ABC transporter permease [Deltaproteobacteria bacterium]
MQTTKSLTQLALARLAKNYLAQIGFLIVILFFLIAIFGPLIAPYDFLSQNIDRALEEPSLDHLMGTDPMGRDIFSRMIFGARTAAIIAFTTTIISLILGIIIGTIAGFSGGKIDSILMWFTDVTMSVPGLLLAILINASIKPPISNFFDSLYQTTKNPFFLNTYLIDFVIVFGAIALISWPGYARIIRGQILSLRQQVFVEAAVSMGSSFWHMMRKHLVPNALGPIVVTVTQGIGAAILLESSLSFLGVGVQPPNASWGSMLSDSLSLWRSFPHLMLVPAITIGIIQIAFIFLGDGINDALNPKQSRR